jgi:N-acetylmuramic acid 6-phosphate etherase
MSRVRYDRLPTERADRGAPHLDRLSARQVVRLVIAAERRTIAAAARAVPGIAAVADMAALALAAGGRLILMGAGTSGRLAVLESAECPPTFGSEPALVQAVMAGGRRAVFRAREGAEDDAGAARREMRRRARPGDVVVGIAASGVTPFVRSGLAEARRRGARTVLLTCNPAVPRGAAHLVVALAVGPEVLAGSTRLKAGTATKLALNALTTAMFAGLGKVHGNRMVDLEPRSAKLRARARRMVADLGGVDGRRAARLLAEAGGRAKVAIAMARLGLPRGQAERRLASAGGRLRAALETR